jgi:hypothetical protein
VNGGLAYVGCPKSNVQHFLFQTYFIYIIHLTIKAFTVVSSHLTTAAQCSGNFYIPCNCPLQLISPICQVIVVFIVSKDCYHWPHGGSFSSGKSGVFILQLYGLWGCTSCC